MDITIRRADTDDLYGVMAVINDAQNEMHAEGIPQWINGYPDERQILEDIHGGDSYVLEEEGQIAGTFCLKESPDPYYSVIDGAWLNREPYAVIHRSAVRTSLRGQHLFHQMIKWSEEKIRRDGLRNIRIDTHEKNMPMRHALKNEGFTYCGTIVIADGTQRYAYQRIFD